jgi:hypothetical protein
MLPKGTLGRQQRRKLKVYGGSNHPHGSQNPEPLAAEGPIPIYLEAPPTPTRNPGKVKAAEAKRSAPKAAPKKKAPRRKPAAKKASSRKSTKPKENKS